MEQVTKEELDKLEKEVSAIYSTIEMMGVENEIIVPDGTKYSSYNISEVKDKMVQAIQSGNIDETTKRKYLEMYLTELGGEEVDFLPDDSKQVVRAMREIEEESGSEIADTYLDTQQKMGKITQEEKNIISRVQGERRNNTRNPATYVIDRTAVGVSAGMTGIAQAGLTETANELREGSQMATSDVINERVDFSSATNLFAPDAVTTIVKAPGRFKRTINILRDKDLGFGEKITTIFSDAVTYTIEDMPIKQGYDSVMHKIGKAAPELNENVMDINDTISDPIQEKQEALNEESKNYGAVTQVIGNVGQSVGNMAINVAAGAITKNPTIALGTMGVSAKGQATNEALRRGADLNEAVKIGNAKGMIEIGTEMLVGGVNIFGKGALDDILERGIVSNIKNEVAKKMASEGIKYAGEVTEETISDILGTFIDRATVDPNATYTIKDWGDTALTTVLSTAVLNTITRGLVGQIDYNQQVNSINEVSDIHANNEISDINTKPNMFGQRIDGTTINLQDMQINVQNLLHTLNSDLTLENAVSLLKIRESSNIPNIRTVIDSKLQGYELLGEAKDIMQYDKSVNGLFNSIEQEDKIKLAKEIMENPNIQNFLQKRRLQHKGVLDKQLAVYVKMVEEVDLKKYYAPKLQEISEEKILKQNQEKQTQKDINEPTTIKEDTSITQTIDTKNPTILDKMKQFFQKTFRRNNKTLALPEARIIKLDSIGDVLRNGISERINGMPTYDSQRMELDINSLLGTLNSKLTLDNAVSLLKIKNNVNNSNITSIINDKLKGYRLLKQANEIVAYDRSANAIFRTIPIEQRQALVKEISENGNLQQELDQKRLQHKDTINKYLATYIKMGEESDIKKYFEERTSYIYRLQAQNNQRGISQERQQTIRRQQETKAQQINRRQQEAKTQQIDRRQQNLDLSQKREAFIEELKIHREQLSKPQYSFDSIEGAIQQYLMSYLHESKTKGRTDSYSALVNIAGKIEQSQVSNVAEQKSLLNYLKKNNYMVVPQGKENGDKSASFWHIRNKQYVRAQSEGLKNTTRLYINPTRENTFKLAKEIINRMGNKPLYLKFMSDEQMSSISRNEKIVVYTSNQNMKGNISNLNQVINVLNQIKKDRPDLLKGCNIINPFMKRVEGVAGIANNPEDGQYTYISGMKKKLSPSYNTFLANALDESVTRAINEIAEGQPGMLQKMYTIPMEERIEKMMSACPNKFIEKIKQYLQQCQNNNPILDIRGLQKTAERAGNGR